MDADLTSSSSSSGRKENNTQDSTVRGRHHTGCCPVIYSSGDRKDILPDVLGDIDSSVIGDMDMHR